MLKIIIGSYNKGPEVAGDAERACEMQMDDMVLVSVDDHVVEPRDMFERHMPVRYRDLAPRNIRLGTRDRWVFEDSFVPMRSEEHTSELQSLMRISYAVFCLKKKIRKKRQSYTYYSTKAQTE